MPLPIIVDSTFAAAFAARGLGAPAVLACLTQLGSIDANKADLGAGVDCIAVEDARFDTQQCSAPAAKPAGMASLAKPDAGTAAAD